VVDLQGEEEEMVEVVDLRGEEEEEEMVMVHQVVDLLLWVVWVMVDVVVFVL
jgi:hypothetical protein